MADDLRGPGGAVSERPTEPIRHPAIVRAVQIQPTNSMLIGK